MRRTRSHSRRTSAAERGRGAAGNTIVELAITCSLLLVVLGVIYSSLENVMKAEAFENDRSTSLDTMRTVLNRMTRELRQASTVDETTSTPSHISFVSYAGGATHRFVYNATGTTLTRQVDGGATLTVVTGLASTSLFTYVIAPPVPGAQWVQINLQVRPRNTPDTVLVLDSEVNLRNRTSALS
jgi:Tfp pilus assembly protein PilW